MQHGCKSRKREAGHDDPGLRLDGHDEFAGTLDHVPCEDGSEHQEGEAPEHKPLQEVRDEVVEKLKMKMATEKAQAQMLQVNEELGKLWTEKGGYPSDAFGKLKAQFSLKKIDLVQDVTLSFAQDQVAEVEKIVGENSQLGGWGFKADNKPGKISDQPVTTTKGVILFRLEKRAKS